jgi:hypothetical protein
MSAYPVKRREEASVASAVRVVWNWEDSLVFVRMVLWDMVRVAAVDPVELDVDVDVEVRDVSRRRSILVCDDLILVIVWFVSIQFDQRGGPL